jgi:RNA polymerase sigma-70 factor (ECF subfamily)
MASEQSSLASFEHLVRVNQRTVFQIALSVVGNSADAEDVTQDAFVRAYCKFESLKEPERFRAWVCRIARRVALNRLRSDIRFRKREERSYDDANARVDIEAEAEEREFQRRLRAEIDRLPKRLRDVVLLCAIEGLEPTEVAAMLGIPAGTARSRLHAGRKHLLRVMS